MRVLFWSLSIFCLGFLLHLMVWKIRLPKRQTKVLLQILFGTLIGVLGVLLTNPEIEIFGIEVPANTIEYFHIFLFYTALTLSYMITYSALEADSPSLVIVMSIATTGKEGLDKEAFHSKLNDDVLIRPRVMDLILDKMAYMDGERICLTSKGVMLAKIFTIYRNLMGIQTKGG